MASSQTDRATCKSLGPWCVCRGPGRVSSEKSHSPYPSRARRKSRRHECRSHFEADKIHDRIRLRTGNSTFSWLGILPASRKALKQIKIKISRTGYCSPLISLAPPLHSSAINSSIASFAIAVTLAQLGDVLRKGAERDRSGCAIFDLVRRRRGLRGEKQGRSDPHKSQGMKTESPPSMENMHGAPTAADSGTIVQARPACYGIRSSGSEQRGARRTCQERITLHGDQYSTRTR